MNMRTFHTIKYVQIVTKHIAWCSNSPVMSEMQIKSTGKYHYISIKTAKIEKTDKLVSPNLLFTLLLCHFL